ncbi:MAG: hypothetical protein IIB56_14680 [Planctomycetes bacterium]|nr:hypothetical protein [Planctomycetota bacterium]
MRDRDFGMCFHWSNLRHFDQSKMRFASEHHHLHTGRNLLRNDSPEWKYAAAALAEVS